MFGIKVLLKCAAFSSALCALILLWNESEVSCGYTMTKVLETVFILSALVLTREYADIKIEHHE